MTPPTQSKPNDSIYAIIGRERFLRQSALQDTLGTLSDCVDDVGTTRMNGPEVTISDVLDEVRTLSLLGDRRIVVVDEADSFISANREILERYCTNPSPDGTLIFLCQSMPKNTRLYRIIAKHGTVISCDPPKGRAVNAWIVACAEQYNRRLSPAVAQRLRDHLGDDVGRLDSEIAKLTTYVGDRKTISAADIDALTGMHREEKVFAVTDAISSGDTATALSQWEQVLATDRAAPARAIAGLAWGIRRLLQARRDWETGTPIYALSKRMFTDPAVLEKRLKRLNVIQLEQQLQDLLTADLAIKTGMSTIESVIEKFIVKHSLVGSSPAHKNRGNAA